MSKEVERESPDEYIVKLLEVRVHSGTDMEKKWEINLLKALDSGDVSAEDINRVIWNPPRYFGGRWVMSRLYTFVEKYPKYTNILKDVRML